MSNESATIPSTSSNKATSSPGKIFLYFSPLTMLVYLPLPTAFLLDIATTFMLKNQLHASATEVSLFRLMTALPVYFSFVFGLTRDLWNPFGLRDRGYFLIFGGASVLTFLWMAWTGVSYWRLFIGMMLAMITFRFISAAYQGLLALVGQEQLISGRLSAVWQIVSSIPFVVGGFASGYISENLTPANTFVFVAILSAGIVGFGIWKPRSVFAHAYDKPLARGAGFVGDIKRLLKHRAIYPAVLIMLLFQFAPGTNTPLQFYLTDQLHLSDAMYGYFNGAFVASFIPVYFLYGWLCKRVSLKKLLWWGMIITVPQMVPLVFIHSAFAAIVAAVLMGFMGGIAAVSIYDLSIRSCPPGLQGTLMMLVDGVYSLSTRGGDVLGVWIYNKSPAHGFLYCVIAITFVYALILPVLLFIPKEVIATADGEANPELEREVLAEVAEA